MSKPGSAEDLERVRLIAARMFGQGLKTGQVAASLSVDEQTVRRWRRVYEARGADGLRSRPHPGGRRRLSDAQRGRLREMLLKAPSEWGFDRHLWTQQLIADLVAREFGARACKRAGVPVWHPHQLRHTYGTLMRKRHGIETARILLGHKSPAMTLVYAEADRAKAMQPRPPRMP